MYSRIILSMLFATGLVFAQHNILIKNKISGDILRFDVSDIESITFEDVVKDTNCIVRTKTYQVLDWNRKPVYMVKVSCDPDILADCSQYFTALNKNNTKYSGYTDQDGKVTLTLYMPLTSALGRSCVTSGYNIKCDKPLEYIDLINNVYVFKYK